MGATRFREAEMSVKWAMVFGATDVRLSQPSGLAP